MSQNSQAGLRTLSLESGIESLLDGSEGREAQLARLFRGHTFGHEIHLAPLPHLTPGNG